MFDAELNEPQSQAVAHIKGPLLVFAGAGSGKTRVITYRIANLVATAHVAPFRILAVTFTNKAAAEMRERLAKLCGDAVAKDLWVGTFHATCAKLLRVHGASIGLSRNFVIYDASDQKSVVTRALRELDLDEKRYPPRAALGWIHKQKQEGRGPDEAVSDSYSGDAFVKLYRAYEEKLRAANAVDFEDLILYVGRILADPDNPEGDKIRRRYEYVLVDEFQDTNATQYAFLRHLARDHHNICVVGDDDQSIYRWRGADVRNIRGFKRDFPGAEVVKLEQNYRSSANIVRAALGVITRSSTREPKELWTANEAGTPIEVVAVPTERDEAAHVVRTVQTARMAGVDPGKIAVFYRIHAQSRVLEEALRSVNVPYQIVGGMRFFERAEVKDALSYLRVLVNPSSDVDLLRVINTPPRGIGANTIDKLTTFAAFNGLGVYDALDRLDAIDDLGSAPRKKLAAFYALIVELRASAVLETPSGIFAKLLDRTGYRQALAQEQSTEADARAENLQELYGSLRDFEEEAAAAGEQASLDAFLERVTLASDTDQVERGAKITLMTVHSAKGLEFDLVLLTGMEEEMFPYRGLERGGEEELEEERRLAYVAVTRARKHLVVTHVATRQIFGTTRWGRPSRFLDDFPRDTVVHKGVGQKRERYVDEAPSRASYGTSSGSWSHPQASSPPMPSRPKARVPPEVAPGERFVDTEFFADAPSDFDDAGDGEGGAFRRGSRVVHTRFGEGEVRRIESAGEPAVVAFFPGWGEKKILARFLKRA